MFSRQGGRARVSPENTWGHVLWVGARGLMPNSVRLNALTRDELIELAEAGCAASLRVRNRADTLIARRRPLPAWCVDVLQSDDILLQVFQTLDSEDRTLNAVCTVWAGTWRSLLRQRGCLRLERVLKLPRTTAWSDPLSIAIMPDFTVCVATGDEAQVLQGDGKLCFMSSRGEALDDGGSWGALALRWGWLRPTGMLVLSEVMYVADEREGRVRMVRLRDGEALASAHVKAPGKMVLCENQLVVVQEGFLGVSILEATTLELLASIDVMEINCCAAYRGELYLGGTVPGELRVYSLEGVHRRTVNGDFRVPSAMAVHDDRLLMIDEPSDDELLDQPLDDDVEIEQVIVINFEGKVRQKLRLRGAEATGLRDICVHGDEIYLLSWTGTRCTCSCKI